MKLITFILLILLVSCNSLVSEKELVLNEVTITESSRSIEPDSTINFELSITYLDPVSGPTYLVDSINKVTQKLLSSWFSLNNDKGFGLAVASKNKMKAFVDKVKQAPNPDCFTCKVNQIKITIDHVFQNKDLLNIVYQWYLFEGGAHPNYARKSIVMNKKTGAIVTYADLLKNPEKVRLLAEQAFRQEIGLKDGDAYDNLYQFDNDVFHLGKQFVITDKGLTIFYNPYEIAPYSAGIIEIEIPYEHLKDCLNFDLP